MGREESLPTFEEGCGKNVILVRDRWRVLREVL